MAFLRSQECFDGLEGGEVEFRRAVELDRASVEAAFHYAGCLHVQARWDEAVKEYRRALELDPVSTRLNVESFLSSWTPADTSRRSSNSRGLSNWIRATGPRTARPAASINFKAERTKP